MKIDVSKTIQPKSDQLNADDLISSTRTLKVRDVKGSQSSEQPVWVFYEGDNNKPYKPCLSMRRLLVKVWGDDAANWIGKSMVVYRDDDVTFGKVKVGGIRISHVTGIEKDTTVVLTESRAKRKPFVVKPLNIKPKDKPELHPGDEEKWRGAVESVRAGTHTIEQIKQARKLTPENESKLKEEASNESN